MAVLTKKLMDQNLLNLYPAHNPAPPLTSCPPASQPPPPSNRLSVVPPEETSACRNPARQGRQARGTPGASDDGLLGEGQMEAISAEYSPRRPLPLAALRNPYGPSGGATIMDGCSLDSSPPPPTCLPAAAPRKSSRLPGARPSLGACPAGQSPPGDACPDVGKPHRSPGRARLALEKLSQSLSLKVLTESWSALLMRQPSKMLQ